MKAIIIKSIIFTQCEHFTRFTITIKERKHKSDATVQLHQRYKKVTQLKLKFGFAITTRNTINKMKIVLFVRFATIL